MTPPPRLLPNSALLLTPPLMLMLAAAVVALAAPLSPPRLLCVSALAPPFPVHVPRPAAVVGRRSGDGSDGTTTRRRHSAPLVAGRVSGSRRGVVRASPALHLSNGTNDGGGGGGGNGGATGTKAKKTKGVYARPSAAIERGSGFFVPGLEGSRVRLLFGVLALVLTYVNNAVGGRTTTDETSSLTAFTGGSYGVSETVALLSGVLLLLQAAVEFGAEMGFGIELGGGGGSDGGGASGGMDRPSSSSSSSSLEQRVSPALSAISPVAADAVRWAGATYVALTPATHVLLIRDDDEGEEPTTLYGLGGFAPAGADENRSGSDDSSGGITAALDEVYSSRGGRISVPSDHPAAVGLLPEAGRRCVLLQRVEVEEKAGGRAAATRKGKRTCLVVGSNQLLPAFTKNDLRWLGRLAGYIGKELS